MPPCLKKLSNLQGTVESKLLIIILIQTSSRNLGLLSLMTSHGPNQHWWPWFNMTDPSSVSIAEYRQWYSHYSSMVDSNITDCSLEEEMNKVMDISQIFVALLRSMDKLNQRCSGVKSKRLQMSKKQM